MEKRAFNRGEAVNREGHPQQVVRGDVKMQVAATASVCSQLQKVAILLCQFRLI